MLAVLATNENIMVYTKENIIVYSSEKVSLGKMQIRLGTRQIMGTHSFQQQFKINTCQIYRQQITDRTDNASIRIRNCIFFIIIV